MRGDIVRDANRSKSHPDIFQAALERLRNVKVDEVVAIGDSAYYAQAASKLRLTSAGLRCGDFPEGDLWAAGFCAVYNGCADLLARYNESMLNEKTAA